MPTVETVSVPVYRYDKLGTLCDEPNCLTCSYAIARDWGQARHIAPYPTFEQAADAVKSGEMDVCLVAGAYPRLNALIFDERITVIETFLWQIPPLVLVGVHEKRPSDIRVLYHHPATTPLLTETGLAFQPTEFVTSNSMACKRILESPEDTVAITNKLCSDFYGLHVYKTLRPGTIMPWIVFGRADPRRATSTHPAITVEDVLLATPPLDDCCP